MRTYWVVELADGSRMRVPSFWTDQPVGGDPPPPLRLGGRATPQALRDLVLLLQQLALGTSPADAPVSPNPIGEADARATEPIRPPEPNWAEQLHRQLDTRTRDCLIAVLIDMAQAALHPPTVDAQESHPDE